MIFASSENVDVRKKIIIYFIVFISLFFFDRANFQFLKLARSGINDIIVYSAAGLKVPFNFLGTVSAKIENLFLKPISQEDIEQYKSEINKLKNEKIANQSRLEYLEKVIGEEKYQFKTQLAKVISYKNNIFSNQITLNKGKNDGVKINDPLVVNNILVGKIVEANFSSSQGVLLTSINSRIPVVIGQKKYNAVLIGDPTSQTKVKLDFLPKFYSFNSGDLIFTSSIDGIMPEKIAVGEIKFDSNNKFHASLYADFPQLKIVSIINLDRKDD
jgi:rod shape-determining protein MreC